jgi:hypothetical protein
MQKAKLISVTRSKKPGKKWDFTFTRKNKKSTFTTSAGNSTMKDYTQHHDENRRKRYLTRHKKDLGTKDPTRAGYISYYVLWGNSTSFRDNLEAYKRRFSL